MWAGRCPVDSAERDAGEPPLILLSGVGRFFQACGGAPVDSAERDALWEFWHCVWGYLLVLDFCIGRFFQACGGAKKKACCDQDESL